LIPVGALLSCSACNDPRFQPKQDMRNDRIHETVGSFQRIERRRPQQIQFLFDAEDRLQEDRKTSMTRTFRYWNQHEERSAASLQAQLSVEQNYILRRAIHGNVNAIPDVWARMVY